MAFAIFSPIVGHTLDTLVEQQIYNNSIQDAQHPHANGMFPEFYASLWSAKTLTVGMFNLFGYIMTIVILFWATIQSLRREEDTYAG